MAKANAAPVKDGRGRTQPLQISKIDDEYLLSVAEIGASGGPPKRTLERYRAEGGGPRYVRVGPKVIRYRAADYREWLLAQRFTHAAEERIARQTATGAGANT